MSNDFSKFDVFRITGLKPRKKSPEELKYGTFNRRLWAVTFDLLILMLFIPVLDGIFSQYYPPVSMDMQKVQSAAEAGNAEGWKAFMAEMRESGYLDRWLANLKFQMVVFTLYSGIFWKLWSATPGKLICGLRVVDVKTEKSIGILQVIMRGMGYMVSATAFFLGFLWIAFDKRKRGWHDYLADTVVVSVPFKIPEWLRTKLKIPTADPSDSQGPSTKEE